MKTDPLKQVRIRKRIEQAQLDQVAGRLEAARAVYEVLLREDGEQPDVLHGLGVLYIQEGRFDEAEGCLRKASQLSPGKGSNWNDLGEALRRLGRMDEAIAAYRQALEVQPAFVEAMNNLGVALAGQAEVEEAKRCFRQAIEADPDYPHPYCNLGVVLEYEGEIDEAMQCYAAAVLRKPDFAEALESYSSLLARHPERLPDAMSRLLEDARNLK